MSFYLFIAMSFHLFILILCAKILCANWALQILNLGSKKTVTSSVFFGLLGSARVKAACKTLLKFTPGQ